MKSRCENPANPRFSAYGGRGITVCDSWQSFAGFLHDMGERPGNLTLDRINCNKGYSKVNCEWRSMAKQNQNRRNNKLSMTLAEEIRAKYAAGERRIDLARAYGVDPKMIANVVNLLAWV